MKNIVFWLSLSVALLVVGWGDSSLAQAEDDASPAVQPFEQALAVDAVGDGNDYWQLLDEAMRLDPEFSLARWYAGQVSFQGRWQSVDAVGDQVARGALWREYEYRRQEAEPTVEGHTELAKWCRRENLEHEQSWHWQQVLKLDPDNSEARSGLGLISYRGGWYTQKQIEQYEQQAELQERKTEQYERKLRTWINQGRRGSDTLRAEILSRIESIDDPLAVEALGRAMNEVLSNHSSKHQAYHQEVNLAIVRALGNVSEHEATISLLNIAVYADDATLRKQAASKLRGREATSYMPLLMAHLASRIETSFQINVTPAGHVSVLQDIEEEHPQRVERETMAQDLSSHKVEITQRVRRGVASTPIVRTFADPAGDYQRAKSLVQSRLSQVAKTNQQREAKNERIVEVLETVTDHKFGNAPSAWWKSWSLYNELEYYDEKPIEEDYYLSDYRPYEFDYYLRTASCFVAGTPVWTQSGRKPIEHVQIGDFVLSQDPKSGRLDYRPVIDTTIRPPSPLRKLTINGETITTTLGHRFWVAGEGWRMAKFLDVGNQLFSTRGSLELGNLETVEQDEAYNLVVEDFHTYFVGNNRVLVHDNNCPQPTVNALPGVSTKDWQQATQMVKAN